MILDIESQPRWRDGIAGIERTGQGWTEITTRGERIGIQARSGHRGGDPDVVCQQLRLPRSLDWAG